MDATKCIEYARQTANTICPETSALHLAIDWIEHKIGKKKGKITASTLHTYLERVIYNALFKEEDSFDLSDWEAEDFVMLVEERIDYYKDKKRLSPKYIKDTLGNFKEILKFGAEAGYCDPVDLSHITNIWSGNSTHPYLLGPTEFDRFLRMCQRDGSREVLIDAARAALMFYGTLRPVELSRLMLADMHGSAEDFYVDIHRSKTRAGRRRVVFSSLASPLAMEVVQSYLTLRHDEFTDIPGRPWSAIALFGEEARVEPYTPSDTGAAIAKALRPFLVMAL
jgi:integrase